MAQSDKLNQAYNRMLERVKNFAADKGERLREGIEKAKEKAVELEELTLHEAEEIGNYLRRDLEDAGSYLAETGQEIKEWLRFDVELIEDRYLEMFLSVADQTKLELLNLERKAQMDIEYHAGQITGMGSLVCMQCQHVLQFHHTQSIPQCPKCQNKEFKRAVD